MKKYFEGVKTIEELKKAYFKAAMENHPDHGGDLETMKAINNMYAELQKKLKDVHAKHGTNKTYTAANGTTEVPEDFINIVNELLKFEGLEIELCGRWLWIGGNTKEHKDDLKTLGCKWCSQKKLWSWHFPEDGKKRHKGVMPMDEIRETYGSSVIRETASLTA